MPGGFRASSANIALGINQPLAFSDAVTYAEFGHGRTYHGWVFGCVRFS